MTFTPTRYDTYDFANRRHIGPSPAEMAEMLKAVGVANLDQLIDETVPDAIRQVEPDVEQLMRLMRSAVRSRDRGSEAENCHATVAAEPTSMTESRPNPISAVDDATTPAPIATTASMML